MLHFSFKCEQNWMEIERLSGVHHSNLSNNELFRSPLLLKHFFKRRSIHFFRNSLVGLSFYYCPFLSRFARSASKLDCRRGLNIFRLMFCVENDKIKIKIWEFLKVHLFCDKFDVQKPNKCLHAIRNMPKSCKSHPELFTSHRFSIP